MTNPYYTPGQVPLSTWQLGADPDALDVAASAWELLGAGMHDREEMLADGADTLLSSVWSGEARDSYEQHHNRFLESLEEAGVEMESFGGALRELAALARSVQQSMDLNHQGVTGLYQHTVSGDQVTFRETDMDSVSEWVSSANTKRQEYQEACATLRNAIDTDSWDTLLARWQDVASGAADPFELPEELDQTGIIYVDGTVVVGTGSGNDTVQVTIAEDGSIIVTVNGKEHWYAPDTPITILTGGGNDVIEVAPGVPVTLTLAGGRGTDQITAPGEGSYEVNLLDGGAGDDTTRGAGIRVVAQIDNPADLSFIQVEGSDEFVEQAEAGLAILQSELELVGSDGIVEISGDQDDLHYLEDTNDPSWWPGEHKIIIREGAWPYGDTTRCSEEGSTSGNRITEITDYPPEEYDPTGRIPVSTSGLGGETKLLDFPGNFSAELSDEADDRLRGRVREPYWK